jgi:uncharacterized protein YegL
MKKGLVELVFILDRSGSMSGLETDTIGGFNSMINSQKTIDGECRVTTVLFDDRIELLHDRIDLKGISKLTEKEYYVRGSTALLDAIGATINKIVSVQRNTSDEERAEKVLFVITTDGYENASREYSYGKVKAMIEKERDKYGWEFLFLGANIDALETAAKFGISKDRAADYHADGQGTRVTYQAMDQAVRTIRENKEMSKDWKKMVDEDYKNRKKKS